MRNVSPGFSNLACAGAKLSLFKSSPGTAGQTCRPAPFMVERTEAASKGEGVLPACGSCPSGRTEPLAQLPGVLGGWGPKAMAKLPLVCEARQRLCWTAARASGKS